MTRRLFLVTEDITDVAVARTEGFDSVEYVLLPMQIGNEDLPADILDIIGSAENISENIRLALELFLIKEKVEAFQARCKEEKAESFFAISKTCYLYTKVFGKFNNKYDMNLFEILSNSVN
jgi:hypothetical protein